ncbi:uncharacterized protein (DUF934 family) [Rubricella aquisinus]|uniref:Uncharacterized protein (DUF934 family) n=1 Tax=Rubricella aquisinus TaxID=2028108 RepID=A0A840X1W7_9RHOB|nr:DUF934 domain-containing protein [Rubricella aquisinus]MBB5515856.1 uncharacterized protein (DUF934 family) [Rubricella aquisinus]
MSVIVTKNGFSKDTSNAGFTPLDDWQGAGGIDLPNTADAAEVFDKVKDAPALRIPFPSFADGRGFTLARRLRRLGYAGTLRAEGHILSDQFRHARRCGFDEVEISDAQALRQPEDHWPRDLPPAYQFRVGTAA